MVQTSEPIQFFQVGRGVSLRLTTLVYRSSRHPLGPRLPYHIGPRTVPDYPTRKPSPFHFHNQHLTSQPRQHLSPSRRSAPDRTSDNRINPLSTRQRIGQMRTSVGHTTAPDVAFYLHGLRLPYIPHSFNHLTFVPTFVQRRYTSFSTLLLLVLTIGSHFCATKIL
jgi:hypothetical protein